MEKFFPDNTTEMYYDNGVLAKSRDGKVYYYDGSQKIHDKKIYVEMYLNHIYKNYKINSVLVPEVMLICIDFLVENLDKNFWLINSVKYGEYKHCDYKHDKKDGMYCVYNDTHIMTVQGSYKNDCKDGVWKNCQNRRV